jgi:hypothetical protein
MSATQTPNEEENLSNDLRCSRCDSILPPHALFCGKCGEQLQDETEKAQWSWLWPVIILLSALAANLAAFLLPGTVVRLTIEAWFLFVCPGMALVRLFHFKEAAVEWTLALALSFAIDALIAGMLLYTGKWSPVATLVGVTSLSVGSAIAQLAHIVFHRAVGSTDDITIRLRRPHPALARPQRLLKLPPVARLWKPDTRLPLGLAMLLIVLTVVASVCSPVYKSPSTSRATALSNAPPTQSSSDTATKSAATPAASPATDAVIVMDNVNQIDNFDPQGQRFAAAQLFVSLASIGDRIGIVRITSSPTPAKILDLQTIKNSSDPEQIQSKLSGTFFGPIDPNPTAFFTPALQTAGNMLRLEPATDQKDILLITDAVALSGDQNTCPGSPDNFHNWFCVVNTLKSQGISVVLLGFTRPGSATELPTAKRYIEAQGGKVLQIADGDNLPEELSRVFSALLSPGSQNSLSKNLGRGPQ